ncbi:hypothetical protein [Asticcacaulis machinosus]|uniref:Uncharacterized protein n=1 Tax=Asticcacaulis machinosus TaxID=2984211 RepID=A0ABT5HMQ4_9CAUL|nr:hypothetical protein [Asticcacaulis machinosus]MDC7677507.1 hypothetical protein [Asticcacaulis machinosus]
MELRFFRTSSLLGIVLTLGSTGYATAQSSPSPTSTEASKSHETASQSVSAPASPTNDPDWLEKNKGFKGAAVAPLEDLNLRRLEIPEILIIATQKPYNLTGLRTCKTIAAEISRLDEVLGPDIDANKSIDDQSLTEKGESMANRAAIGAVRSTTTGILPFRGLVRKMTGAEKHQQQVDSAIEAGQSRRAYLKGVGITKNCAPPAAPAGFVPKKAATSKANIKR